MSFDDFQKAILEKYKEDNSELVMTMREEKEKLELEKLRKEKELLTFIRNAIIKDVDAEQIDAIKKEFHNEIETLEIKIDGYTEQTWLEEYLLKLPSILYKTFELGNTALKQKEKAVIKEDILKLMELTTFELTLDTKKELTVKLFDVLKDLENTNGGLYRIRTYDPLLVRQML